MRIPVPLDQQPHPTPGHHDGPIHGNRGVGPFPELGKVWGTVGRLQKLLFQSVELPLSNLNGVA